MILMLFFQLVLISTLINGAIVASNSNEIESSDLELSDGNILDGEKELMSASFNCPWPFGSFSDPSDCSKYYSCVLGRATRKNCPPFTNFDKRLRRCVSVWIAVCDDTKDPIEETTGKPTISSYQHSTEVSTLKDGTFSCPSIAGTFLHSTDCWKYYVCASFIPSLKTCPDGELFDGIKKKCEPAEQVHCGQRLRPDDLNTKTSKNNHYTHPSSKHTNPSSKHTHPGSKYTHPSSRHTHPSSRHTHPGSKHTHSSSRSTPPSSRHTYPSSRHTHPSSRHTHPSSKHTHPSSRHTHPSSRSTPPSSRSTPPSSKHTHPSSKHTHPGSKHTHPNSRPTPPISRHTSFSDVTSTTAESSNVINTLSPTYQPTDLSSEYVTPNGFPTITTEEVDSTTSLRTKYTISQKPRTVSPEMKTKATAPPETTCDPDDLDCLIDGEGEPDDWFTCPNDIGSHPHPTSTKLFIFCKNWVPTVKKCGQDLVFSEELHTCVSPFRYKF